MASFQSEHIVLRRSNKLKLNQSRQQQQSSDGTKEKMISNGLIKRKSNGGDINEGEHGNRNN